jgi:hypothetical protein
MTDVYPENIGSQNIFLHEIEGVKVYGFLGRIANSRFFQV